LTREHGPFSAVSLEGIRTRERWFRVELIERHGAFSAVSFRSNKDMEEECEG
jgi:hypothetical protein